MIIEQENYQIILRNRKCIESYKSQGHILTQNTKWDNDALFHIRDSTLIDSKFGKEALWGVRNIELINIETGKEALCESKEIYALGGHFKSLYIPASGIMVANEIN
tara:strand:- start:62 stop:379 length:318 start_codon:yes stop_codon:yes gene_type:complete